MRAVFEGDCDRIKNLQAQGFDLKIYDALGRTAAHWAAQGRQQAALE